MKQKLSITQLEKELANVETNALQEERDNAKTNYDILTYYLETLKNNLPYPNITKYTTADDYESLGTLRYQKHCNERHRDKIAFAEPYTKLKKLYMGRLKKDGKDYYILGDNISSYEFKINKSINGSNSVYLINPDDKAHHGQFKMWLNP